MMIGISEEEMNRIKNPKDFITPKVVAVTKDKTGKVTIDKGQIHGKELRANMIKEALDTIFHEAAHLKTQLCRP